MSTTRTLATLAAFAVLVPAGSAVAAVAATDVKKPIKISTSAAPKIIDNPGTGKDVVRLTNVPGVRWSVTGDVDTKYATASSSSEKYVDVPVKSAGTSATVVATVADASTTTLASDISSWTLPFAVKPVDITPSDAPRAQDFPGKTKDAVQLTAVDGVTWTVGDKTIAAFKGTKSFSLTKLAPTGFDGKTITITPSLQDGYSGTVTATTLTLTDTDIVDLPASAIDDAITDNVNLPGRTRDTVTLLPVVGVKWSICDGKTFAVTKPMVKSASCKNTDGTVPIKATADKGYTIATKSDYTKSVLFEDAAARNTITIPDAPVTVNDAAGTLNDTATIAPVPNVVWEVGTATKAKDGTVTFKWSKAPKPKAGVITVKIKPAKGATDSPLYVRPAPVTDDFALSGWVPAGEAATDGGQTFTATTALGTVTVDADHAPVFDGTNNVTLKQVDGVTAWNVTRTLTVNGRTKDVKSVVKVAPYTSVVAAANGATKVVVAPVVDKSYEYKGTPATWESPAATPAPSPTDTPTTSPTA